MPRTARGAQAGRGQGRGGSLFLGVIIGLALGLAVAAGMAWYFYLKPGEFKAVSSVPEVRPKPEPQAAATSPPAARTEMAPLVPVPVPEPVPLSEAPPDPIPPVEKPPGKPPVGKSQPAKPGKSDFTFFDILPGDKPRKPVEAKLPREVWWLQVAALSEAKDADRLKAKLALLGLDVQVQKISVKGNTLHRIRVGPFKTDDDALGALDTLAANQYEPRLLKESLANP